MTEQDLAARLDRIEQLIRESAADRKNDPPDVLTYQEAADRLSISKRKLEGMLARGQILRCPVGDGWGIPYDEILRIRNNKQSAAPKGQRRSGGPKKKATYDPLAEFAALAGPRKST